MIKFGENHPKMGAMCRLYCDQAKRSDKECECKAQSTSDFKVFGFSFQKKSYKAETNGSKMMKFGANVPQTALKGLNLAQTGNYDHVLNLKYTCRALPSCFFFLAVIELDFC